MQLCKFAAYLLFAGGQSFSFVQACMTNCDAKVDITAEGLFWDQVLPWPGDIFKQEHEELQLFKPNKNRTSRNATRWPTSLTKRRNHAGTPGKIMPSVPASHQKLTLIPSNVNVCKVCMLYVQNIEIICVWWLIWMLQQPPISWNEAILGWINYHVGWCHYRLTKYANVNSREREREKLSIDR